MPFLLVFCPVVKINGPLFILMMGIFHFQSKLFVVKDKTAMQMGIPDLMGNPPVLHIHMITFLAPWSR